MRWVTWGLLGLAGLACLAFFWLWWSNEPPRASIGEARSISQGDDVYSYFARGAGPVVVLLPSLGRAASDFNELVLALNDAGYRTLAIDPPGTGDSVLGDTEGVTLHTLAEGVDRIVRAETAGDEEIAVLGHAFGNRVARTYATDYPVRVAATVLLAAGGKVDIEPRILQALTRSFWTFMPDAWRREEVRLAFFSGDNPIPDYWMAGWSVPTAFIQGPATTNTPSEEWWHGGDAPILVVQALDDTIAPPEHTSALLKEEFGDRVTVAEIGDAGHALLPEQPEKIAEAVTGFLRTHLPPGR